MFVFSYRWQRQAGQTYFYILKCFLFLVLTSSNNSCLQNSAHEIIQSISQITAWLVNCYEKTTTEQSDQFKFGYLSLICSLLFLCLIISPNGFYFLWQITLSIESLIALVPCFSYPRPHISWMLLATSLHLQDALKLKYPQLHGLQHKCLMVILHTGI